MSAEPWRRSGTPVAARLFVWQAWYFGGLRLDLRGRCGTFETFVDGYILVEKMDQERLRALAVPACTAANSPTGGAGD